MKTVEVKTIGDAKGIMSGLAMIQVGLALRQGHTVTVVDERRDVEYVFRPENAEETAADV